MNTNHYGIFFERKKETHTRPPIEWWCPECHTWVKNESYCPKCGKFFDISKIVYHPVSEDFSMLVEDVFNIENWGIVITGIIHTGEVLRGDKIIISSYSGSTRIEAKVFGAELFKIVWGRAEFGDNVGLMLKGVTYGDIKPLLSSPAYAYKGNGDKLILPEIERRMNQSQSDNSSAESEYLEEVRACLSEDGEISSRERRLLNRLREKLGISEVRANELEESLKKPQLTEDEQEYYEEYKACLEDETELSPRSRRLLDRFRSKLGISEERAKEIEKL